MKDKIRTLLEDIIAGEEKNLLPEELGLTEGGARIPIFEAPLVAFGAAADPMFDQLRRPEIVGPHAAMPADFMPEARTVIAAYLPFSKPLRDSNREGKLASHTWLYGTKYMMAVSPIINEKFLAGLEALGLKAVIPSKSEQFKAIIGDGAGHGVVIGKGVADDPLWAGRSYTCNWSERHAAYICGLGTFGMAGGIITEKGMAGNLLTVLIDRELEPTPRAYSDPFEYCIRCGACARRCPGHSISMETGYSPQACVAWEEEAFKQTAPMRGCSKCRVTVPCEDRNPSKKGK